MSIKMLHQLAEKYRQLKVHFHTREERREKGDITTASKGENQVDSAINKTCCTGPRSKLEILSFIVMIMGFTFATPLSLLLTIPAYAFADRVS